MLFIYRNLYNRNHKNPVGFSSARGMCEPFGRADAADRCRGGDHRGEDKSTPGQECKPTQLTRRAPSGDPPGGDRLTHWHMSLPTLQ